MQINLNINWFYEYNQVLYICAVKRKCSIQCLLIAPSDFGIHFQRMVLIALPVLYFTFHRGWQLYIPGDVKI